MSITAPDENRYIEVNDAYAALVGCPREKLVGQINSELQWPDTPPGSTEALPLPALLVEQPMRLRTHAGDFRDVIASTQYEDWGGHSYVLTLVQDLTDYNRFQSALRAAEARFRLFFESIPLPVFVFDFETWRILDVNAATVQLYGYSRDELLSMTMLDLRPPEMAARYTEAIRALPSEARFVGVWQHRKKDGALVDIELTSYAFDLDGRAVRLHVLRDVTEKLSLQRALRQSEERLQIITDVTTDVIWDWDLTRDTLDTVDLYELFGYDPASKGNSSWWFEHMHPEDREATESSFRAALASGQPFWSAQYRFLHADGRAIFVQNRAQILHDENGAARRVIGATVDISRQVEIQEAATQAKLEERRRLARDLHDAVTQSLYSLSLMAEVARRRAAAGDERGANEYVARLGELALQSLKEMRLLVYELQPSALENEGLIGALQSRLDAVERRSGIRARLVDETEGHLPPNVQTQFFLIAAEALNNALKHAAAASVRIHITADETRVGIEISDDGKGFEAITAQPPSGLGLVSMRERAEKMGGHFSLETAPGRGTTIRVTLDFGEGGS